MSFRKWISAAMRGPRAIAVLFGVISLQGNVSTVHAQSPDFRGPDSAPAAWGAFSALVKHHFEQNMVADDPIANRFRAWLTQSRGKPDAAPASVVVRVWLKSDGVVDRVSFPPLPDGKANDDLQVILMRGHVGKAPPADMLQPLNLRFSLNLPT